MQFKNIDFCAGVVCCGFRRIDGCPRERARSLLSGRAPIVLHFAVRKSTAGKSS